MQNTPFAAQQRQVNKFLEATRKLGAQMDQDQGTTRVIYDTTGDKTTSFDSFSFFSEVTSKTFPATNLDQNRFQPGEGMVIKEIGICDLLQNTIQLQKDFIALAVIDFYIGNNRVLKSLPLTAFSTIAALNPLNSVNYNIISANGVPISAIRLRTNLVIPPMVQFRCDIRFPFPVTATVQNPVNFKLYVKGYGKLFNPNANY